MERSFKYLSVVLIAFLAIFLNSCKPDNPYDFAADLDLNRDDLSFEVLGGKEYIKLYSNRDWATKIEYKGGGNGWVKISPDAGAASLDTTLVEVSVEANTGMARKAEIIFSIGTEVETLEISQEGNPIPDNVVPISEVRALFQSDPIEIEYDWSIKGVVISDYRKAEDGGLNNATSAKCVVITDEDAGIQLRLKEDNKEFEKGDEIVVGLKGLTIQRYQNGSIQVNDVPLENVVESGKGKVVSPLNITAEQLLSGDFESMYVAVKDVQTKETGDIVFATSSSHKSVPFVSKEGSAFDLFSSKYSTFASEKVPTGSGVLKGIATLYNGAYQISITSTDDYKGLTGERFNVSTDTKSKVVGDYSKWSALAAVSTFVDDFSNSKGNNKEYEDVNWMFYTNDGSSSNYCFRSTIYSYNKYLDIAPYNSSAEKVVSYALLPPVNIKEMSLRALNFKMAFYYQNQDNSTLEVVLSTDFKGDFESANWKVVKDVTFDKDDKINNWISVSVSLSNYSSVSQGALALRYTGKANTYRIDNIVLGAAADPDEYKAPTPVSTVKSDPVNKWMELPVVNTTDTKAYISHHAKVNNQSVRNYSMLYDTENRVALWTAYHIASHSFGPTSRTDKWEYDPKIPRKNQPTLYSGWGVSGHDRGHILPSGSRTANYESNAMTFFFSNMTIQNSKLNQGVWAKLEDKVRGYITTCDTLYVVTGSVLQTSANPDIHYETDKEGNKVAKPQAYFKVVMKYSVSSDKYESIAFWYENKEYPDENPKAENSKSVTWIEEQTGYTFFENLPSSIKKSVKDAHEPSRWGL